MTRMQLPIWITSAQSIAIVGFGREGQSTYRFLRTHLDPSVHINIYDENESENVRALVQKLAVEFNDKRCTGHGGKVFENHFGTESVIFKSPGIPLAKLKFHHDAEQKIRLTSQADLFVQLFGQQTIAVTGTKGKSTTAHAIAHVLNESGKHALLAGNIGVPLLDVVGQVNDDTWIIAELSAFQCDSLTSGTKFAVLTSIYQDHLDYYQSVEQYQQAKRNLFACQTENDYTIYRSDDWESVELIKGTAGQTLPFAGENNEPAAAYIENEEILINGKSILPIDAITIPGRHNVVNCLPAVIVATQLTCTSAQIAAALQTIRPLKGRLEDLGTYNDITFYDDAVATIPQATIAAIHTLGAKVQTLIVGGHDRKQDYASLAETIARAQIQTLITFPTTGREIAALVQAKRKITIIDATSMHDAVKAAYAYTQKGKAVLLSTAAPSFGLFADYQDRSKQYIQCIHDLQPTKQNL